MMSFAVASILVLLLSVIVGVLGMIFGAAGALGFVASVFFDGFSQGKRG